MGAPAALREVLAVVAVLVVMSWVEESGSCSWIVAVGLFVC